MVKSMRKSRRKSRRKSKAKRKSRKCKYGALKNPVKDKETGRMRYCKKAPKKSKRKSRRKSRRKSKAKRKSRKCKYGALKNPVKDKETGRMRYCKKAPKKSKRKSRRKSKRKSRRKSRRKSKGRSTFILHGGRRLPAVYSKSFSEWLNVASNLHLANREQRKAAIKTAKLTGKVVKLEKQLAPLKVELKSLTKNKANKAISNAVVAYGEQKVIKFLNEGFRETRLREAGIRGRMNISAGRRRGNSQ